MHCTCPSLTRHHPLRRRVAVERRHPQARQRQFFARRREHALQNEQRRRALVQRANAAAARVHRNAQAHTPDARRGERNQRDAAPRRRNPLEMCSKIGHDILQIANPSVLDSIVGRLPSPHRQREGEDQGLPKKRRRRERRETATIPLDDSVVGGRHEGDGRMQDESNGIRIFEAETEKTPRYRRRQLGESFLDSEKQAVKEPRQWRTREDGAQTERLSPQGMQRWLASDIKKEAVTPVTLLQPRQKTPIRIRNTRKRALSPGAHKPESFARRLYTPGVHDMTEIHTRGEALHVRATKPTRRETPVFPKPTTPRHFSPRTPSPLLPMKRLRTASPDINPTTTSASRLMLGEQTRKDLSRRFPAIEIDSDSDDATSIQTRIPEKEQNFESLLAKDPFNCDCMSAALIDLEYKLLNAPDCDVRTFGALRKQGEKKSDRELTGKESMVPLQTNPKTDIPFGQKKSSLELKEISLEGKAESSDQSPSTESDGKDTLQITTPCIPQNPITLAGTLPL